MNSITSLIVAIILAFGFTHSSAKFYKLIKKEAITKVYHGLTPLTPLTPFAKELTLKK
jgi:hypothetical protein